MKNRLRLCGYRLAAKGYAVRWANTPYEGYDREDEVREPGWRFTENDGTEYWQLQDASWPEHVYFQSLEPVRSLQQGFRRYARDLDILRVRVDLENIRSPQELEAECLPSAQEAPGARFAVLGFDVGYLLGNYSIIYQPGFMENVDETKRAYWVARLNAHGLFERIDNACTFRDFFEEERSRHAPGVLESGDMELLEVARLCER